MTLSELASALALRSVWDGWTDREVRGAYTSDLLSDVMANAGEGQVLITIQAHKNTVAVAVLKDLAAVILASGRPITDDMTEAARREDLPILVSGDNQYRLGWRIHETCGF